MHVFFKFQILKIIFNYIFFVKLFASLFHLTLPMLSLLSSKAQRRKNKFKPYKSSHVGTHWKVLTEHPQMNTHIPGFSHFLVVFLHNFVLAKSATSIIRVNHNFGPLITITGCPILFIVTLGKWVTKQFLH